MAIARLTGGPLDGQLIPLDDADETQLILPYTEGQLIYRRVGAAENTGERDGATQVAFAYDESTEPIDPADD
ncbi:response regulator [Microbacterium sp. YY-03]|uniref:response regulator n=1 Tax=Microbacterium sp. YY-03 TaxID=3421636 RepID=UPI003D17088F